MKVHLILLVITIPIWSTIAQNDSNTLRQNIEEEYQNVKHQLESIVEWRMHESQDDPLCLKPTLRVGISKIRLYLNHYERWKYRENQRYNLIRDSAKSTTDQIKEDLNNLNITLLRLRNINESLRIAINTIRFIKYELKPDIQKYQLEHSYDIESEFKMECDSLNGILGSTVQLARRLLPPDLKRMLIPPQSPIIRIKTIVKTKI